MIMKREEKNPNSQLTYGRFKDKGKETTGSGRRG